MNTSAVRKISNVVDHNEVQDTQRVAITDTSTVLYANSDGKVEKGTFRTENGIRLRIRPPSQ